MAYRLSRKAEEDIIQIYVAGVEMFGAEQAERYHEGLEHTFDFLSRFPFAAAVRTGLQGSPRIHAYRSHIVVYRLDGKHILIQRVRHASEDWVAPP